jgi:nucleoside-diphosphate-sugar epimerase
MRWAKKHEHDVFGVEMPADCRRFFEYDVDHHVDPMAFDLVIHCAAVVGGRATIDGEPLRLMAEDLSIDAGLFRWALRARPGRIVYFSSSAAYPAYMQHGDQSVGRRMDEDTHRVEMSCADATYGAVKVVGERLAREANAAGIRTHVFRPFSGYGTDQSLDYPFPSFIRRAAQRETPFDVWGSGDSARDWIHIDDIVGAVLAAIDNDVLGPINLCTGRATTFDQLAAMCMDRAGYTAPIRHLDDAPRGVHWRVGDPTRMHEFYRPRVTLEEGIARALEAAQ